MLSAAYPVTASVYAPAGKPLAMVAAPFSSVVTVVLPMVTCTPAAGVTTGSEVKVLSFHIHCFWATVTVNASPGLGWAAESVTELTT
ncbi:hypothetical protein D3C75_785460 [compost metagenome]